MLLGDGPREAPNHDRSTYIFYCGAEVSYAHISQFEHRKAAAIGLLPSAKRCSRPFVKIYTEIETSHGHHLKWTLKLVIVGIVS